MAKINQRARSASRTHEGAKTFSQDAETELRRTVCACLLWEDSFYESGVSIADRISSLVSKIDPLRMYDLALWARNEMKLRHVPLLLAREMAKLPDHKFIVADVLADIIQRPDELTEYVSMYWKDGKKPLSAQSKKGLARAFQKFNEYSLAKYNRPDAVKLRDVLFLSHATPKDKTQEALWKKLIDGKLATPDTWEVELSASTDKKASWERLITEDKLGALAILRNLSNMKKANVAPQLVRKAIEGLSTERVLPYRFIAASRFAPDFEPELEKKMLTCLEGSEKFVGRTLLLVDVSGSMDSRLSGKSDLMNIDAACGLAILLRELGEVDVYTFSSALAQVPARRGFALRDVIIKSQPHSSTELGAALNTAKKHSTGTEYARTIVITDEQSSDRVGGPVGKGYMVNVASNKNGVGYGDWTRVTGWSEGVVRFILETEKMERAL
jgi:60 kDa SS-A/Ro ribonucleoprotein